MSATNNGGPAFLTFDEWYSAKHGRSFEEEWMQDNIEVAAAMKALCRAVRDYSTDAMLSAREKGGAA